MPVRMRLGSVTACCVMVTCLLPLQGSSLRAQEDLGSETATVTTDAETLYTESTADTVASALKFLAQQQQRSGAIGTTAPVATTSLAGLAFLAGGNTLGRGPYARHVKECVDYILKNQTLDGYLTATADETSRMHGHGFAIMFLAEAYGMAKPGPTKRINRLKQLKEALNRAVALAEATQSPEGGWNYSPTKNNKQHEGSITVCIVEGLRAARNAGIVVSKDVIDNAVGYMKKSWDGKSSFQYRLGQEGAPSFALAAAGACVLIASGEESIDVQKMITASTNFVRSMPAGLTRDAEHKFWFYGYFYASQAMHFRGNDDWSEWYTDIRDVLLKEQKSSQDGAFWTSPNNEAGGDKAFATAMALLILQMPNEYLPIFQR